MTLKLILTPETFDIGLYHPEMDLDTEVFLGAVPKFVFGLMGWETKRQGDCYGGICPVFVTRREMISRAKEADARERAELLKTLLKTERTKRVVEAAQCSS